MERGELIKTAALAKLELNEIEIEQLTLEVQAILEYFSVMDEADVEGLKPTTQVMLKENRTRSDRSGCSNISDEILSQVPCEEDRFIIIPSVL